MPSFVKQVLCCAVFLLISLAAAGHYDVILSNTDPAEDTAVTLYVNGAILHPQDTECWTAAPPFTQLPLVQPTTVPASAAVVCSVHAATPSAEGPLRITAFDNGGEVLDEAELQLPQEPQPGALEDASLTLQSM